jgi:hypothetical protein
MSSIITLIYDVQEIFPKHEYWKMNTKVYNLSTYGESYNATSDSWSKFRPPPQSVSGKFGYNLKNVRLMFKDTSSTLPVNSKIIIYFDNWEIKESVPLFVNFNAFRRDTSLNVTSPDAYKTTISQINHISPPISTIPFSYKTLHDTYVIPGKPIHVIFISDDINKSIKNLQILIDIDQNDYQTPKSVEKIVNNNKSALCFYDLNGEANLFLYNQDLRIYDDEICPSRSKLIDILNQQIVEYKNKENICNQQIVEYKIKEDECNQQIVEYKIKEDECTNKENVCNQQTVECKNKEDVYNQQIESLQQEISNQKVEYKNLDEILEKQRKNYYDILNNEREQLKKEKSDRNIVEMELEKERNHVEQIQDLLDSEKAKALTFTCPPTPICPTLPSVPIIVACTIIIILIILAIIYIYSKIKKIPMF